MTTRTATTTVPALQMPATTNETASRHNLRPAPPVPAMPVASNQKAAGGIYGLAKIDHRGRVTDAAVERVLGWPPGTRLNIHERPTA